MMNMKKALGLSAAIALCAGAVSAGGFERSSLSTGFLFEKGNYGELSFGSVSPNVSGVAGGVLNSGDMAESYSQIGFAFKTDLSDKFALGFAFDPSSGADINYAAGTGYPLAGTTGHLSGNTLAVIGKYTVANNVSVLAGVKSVSIGGEVSIPAVAGYTGEYTSDRSLGYIVGVAYEKPEIALRVGLTYSSETSHELTTNEVLVIPRPESVTEVELPKSLTLDFQSGVAKDTLVFGSIRWVDWTSTTFAPAIYTAAAGAPLIAHENDTITYSLGVGRKFTETLSGAISVGYEKAQGGTASNLSPTDGYWSVQLGGSYTMDNMKISGGVRYVDIGDATTSVGEFTGNSAIGVGVKIGFTF